MMQRSFDLELPNGMATAVTISTLALMTLFLFPAAVQHLSPAAGAGGDHLGVASTIARRTLGDCGHADQDLTLAAGGVIPAVASHAGCERQELIERLARALEIFFQQLQKQQHMLT